VLVDQRRALAGVAHPVHQLPRARPGRRRKVIAGMPEIMEVEAPGQSRRRDHGRPVDGAPEVAGTEQGALPAREDQRLGVLADELPEM